MSMTASERTTTEVGNFGGFVDAVGGIATMVLAIIALTGLEAERMTAIAVIVFGATLLTQGGTMLTEYARIIFPAGTVASTEQFSGGSLAAVFPVGAAAIVLGVLALLGIYPMVLTAISVIAMGSALTLSANSLWHLHLLRAAANSTSVSGSPHFGTEILASEMASGSAGLQAVAGLAAVVLGILAVAGSYPATLTLVALLILGAIVVLTGSTLSGLVVGFMQPARQPGYHA